jgi:hypothetical protein
MKERFATTSATGRIRLPESRREDLQLRVRPGLPDWPIALPWSGPFDTPQRVKKQSLRGFASSLRRSCFGPIWVISSVGHSVPPLMCTGAVQSSSSESILLF